ncbi:hypothetical protein PENSPDRAFT_670535 [Peniophora sp. CONT]|nr:hypothetical protein PENSPDRAFT_670535 [Peniophora sp. CONT]
MLAAPAGSGPRISQLLPSVTCSTCGDQVSLDELVDHICKPQSTPASVPESSVSKTSLLSQRLQDLTNRRESAATQSSRSSYSTQRSPSPVRTTRPPSEASTIRSNNTYRPDSQFSARHERIPSTSSRAPSIARSASPAASVAPPRAPSAASYRSRTPSSTTSTLNQVPPPTQRAPSAASNRSRAPSNASTRSGMPYPGSVGIALPSQRRPSVASSFRSASSPSEEQRRPSFNQTRTPPPPAFIPRSLSPARAPVTPPIPPPSPGAHSVYAEDDIDTKTGGEAGMAGVGRRGFAAAARAAMFATSAGSLSPFQEQAPSMAGRRSNAPPLLDMARAGALPMLPPIGGASPFTLSPHSPNSQHSLSPRSPHSPESRAYSPTYTTYTTSTTLTNSSTNTTLVNGTSPTPTNPFTLNLPPHFNKGDLSPVSSIPFPLKPGEAAGRSEPLTPTSPGDTARAPFFDNKPTPRPPKAHHDDSDEESLDDMALRLSQELEDLALDFKPSGGGVPRSASPLSDDGSDYGGLAYDAVSDRSSVHSRAASRSNSQPTTPLSLRKPSLPMPFDANVPSVPALDMAAVLRGSSSTVDLGRPEGHARTESRDSSRSRGPGHVRGASRGFAPTMNGPDTGTGPIRPDSRASNRSAPGSRPAAVAEPAGAWGIVRAKTATGGEVAREQRQREAQAEQPPTPRRVGTVSGVLGSSHVHDRVRTRTESGRSSKPRECVKCGVSIEDGRWVRVESGKGVLCESCWKGMYLPKCRRCGLVIEKQAVSSSDGQLKGKYHRDCFNCHTCHKPFPDKSFYVYDGKPFCAYHYHEANDSLCAAPSCGAPIEGPCAVSHAGARYHPEHLTCEFVDEDAEEDDSDYSEDDDTDLRRRLGVRKARTKHRCTTRLDEYWEVEGRMLCERHMHRVMGNASRMARAQRRVTRFIDIAGLR